MGWRSWAFVALAGLAGLGGLSLMPSPDDGRQNASDATVQAPLIAAPPIHPDTLRDVTPTGILPHPPVHAPLKRVAREKPKEPEKEKLPEVLEFRLPLVLDARTLRVKKTTIRLAHLEGPELNEECSSRLGGKWPCGMRARTALRSLVLRNAIRCGDIAETESDEVVAHCEKGATDLALWMLGQGWARAAEAAPAAYREAQEKAEAARKGLWQLEGPVPIAGSADTPSLPSPNILLEDIEITPDDGRAVEADEGLSQAEGRADEGLPPPVEDQAAAAVPRSERPAAFGAFSAPAPLR
ncbi:thermonuclease family protein [Stappia sp. F7233]|uniref:Thermonuclease family protein n=1 Tax=Stappia albiluteola TaxID=2758565 RepID=A0A839AHJ5_9HYPH|nr:thermonuclease family protein [Stappia albiluteola]MBA5779191.1 thermonuclease family protein [Stappia albiluteola]